MSVDANFVSEETDTPSSTDPVFSSLPPGQASPAAQMGCESGSELRGNASGASTPDDMPAASASKTEETVELPVLPFLLQERKGGEVPEEGDLNLGASVGTDLGQKAENQMNWKDTPGNNMEVPDSDDISEFSSPVKRGGLDRDKKMGGADDAGDLGRDKAVPEERSDAVMKEEEEDKDAEPEKQVAELLTEENHTSSSLGDGGNDDVSEDHLESPTTMHDDNLDEQASEGNHAQPIPLAPSELERQKGGLSPSTGENLERRQQNQASSERVATAEALTNEGKSPVEEEIAIGINDNNDTEDRDNESSLTHIGHTNAPQVVEEGEKISEEKQPTPKYTETDDAVGTGSNNTEEIALDNPFQLEHTAAASSTAISDGTEITALPLPKKKANSYENSIDVHDSQVGMSSVCETISMQEISLCNVDISMTEELEGFSEVAVGGDGMVVLPTSNNTIDNPVMEPTKPEADHIDESSLPLAPSTNQKAEAVSTSAHEEDIHMKDTDLAMRADRPEDDTLPRMECDDLAELSNSKPLSNKTCIPDSDDDELPEEGMSPIKITLNSLVIPDLSGNEDETVKVSAQIEKSSIIAIPSSPLKTESLPSSQPQQSPSTIPFGGKEVSGDQDTAPYALFKAEFRSDGSRQNPAQDSMSSPPKKGANASFKREGSQNNDVLMTELKAMKIASIQARNAALEAEIASKRSKLEEVTKDLRSPAAETVKKHIKLLHDYNDIRDIGQGLVGMIADNRGVRIGELYDEFGVGLKD